MGRYSSASASGAASFLLLPEMPPQIPDQEHQLKSSGLSCQTTMERKRTGAQPAQPLANTADRRRQPADDVAFAELAYAVLRRSGW